MDMNSLNGFDKSRFKRIRGIMLAVLFIWLALEFGAFWLANYLVGFNNSFYIITGFVILGFIIKPKQPYKKPSMNNFEDLAAFQKGLSKSYLSRKLASIFFIIPTYLTNIIALLMLITPVRHFLQRKLIEKFAPPGLANMFSGGMNENPFANFGQNMGGFGQNMGGFGQNMGESAHSEDESAQKRSKRQSSNDFIDVDDYNIEGGKRNETSVKVDRPAHNKPPKALEAEVIDVEHEWKS